MSVIGKCHSTSALSGLTTRASAFDTTETKHRLEAAIRERGMSLLARIDHARLAAEVGLALPPTEVFIFGNPKAGTYLMQENQTIGIDLPLKALVWEDRLGKTWLSYNEPEWLAQRHKVTALGKIAAMDVALDMIAASVTESSQPAGP